MVVRRRFTSRKRRFRRRVSRFRAGKRSRPVRRVRFTGGRFRSRSRRFRRSFGRKRFTRRGRFARRSLGGRVLTRKADYVTQLHGNFPVHTLPGVTSLEYYPVFYAQDRFAVSTTTVNINVFNTTDHRYQNQNFLLPNVFARGYPVNHGFLLPSGTSLRPYPLGDVTTVVPIVNPSLPLYGVMFPLQVPVDWASFPEVQIYSMFRLIGATYTFERRQGGITNTIPYTFWINKDPTQPFDCLSTMALHPRTYKRFLRPGRKLRFSFRAMAGSQPQTYKEFGHSVVLPDAADSGTGTVQTALAREISRTQSMRLRKAPWRSCSEVTSVGHPYTINTGDVAGAFATGYVLDKMGASAVTICGPTICITSPYQPLPDTSLGMLDTISQVVPLQASAEAPIYDGRDILVSMQARVQFKSIVVRPQQIGTNPSFTTPMMVNPYHSHPAQTYQVSWAQLPLGQIGVAA